MMLLTKDIENLIEVGKSGSIRTGIKNYFKNRDIINRLHWKEWKTKTTDCSNDDLVNIFKGLVLVENELNWIGGSVAGSIWVYKIIQERNLDEHYEIADFGLRNCDNPYVPFGNSYYGIRTIKEYFKYIDEKTKVNKIKSEQYDKFLQRVSGRKEKRKKAIAELRKLSPETRRKILEELQVKYSSLSIIEKLQLIADDEKYPPEYYPIEWLSISSEEISKLPLDLIKKLYDKLSTKTKGQWKRFSLELKKYDDRKGI